MRYKNTVLGIFIERPNRFIAHVEIDGRLHVCHVKNTGRCKELLIRGARVVLERSDNPARKTEYDLIAVYKGHDLINIDSQAPNKVFHEWLKECELFGDITMIKPEVVYKSSRFDFYLETTEKRIFIEVKGVTLENNGVVLFPDAPTERGVKHLRELIDARENGFDTYICFVIQMKRCRYFTPNTETHPAFAEALKDAADNGVGVLAFNCDVTDDSLRILDIVEISI